MSFDAFFRAAPGVLARGLAGKHAGEQQRFRNDLLQAESDQRAQRLAIEEALLQARMAPQPPARERPFQIGNRLVGANGEVIYEGAAPPDTTRKPWEREGFATPEEYLKWLKDKSRTETRSGGTSPSGPDREASFNETRNLRTEFNTDETAKAYRLSKVAGEQMLRLAQDNTGASDINLLIAAAKVADPNSVVREGEVAIQRLANSLLGRFKLTFANLEEGKMLTPKQRQEIIKAAQSRFGPLQDAYQGHRQRYVNLATRAGADTLDVVGEYTPPAGRGAVPTASVPGAEEATADYEARERELATDAIRRKPENAEKIKARFKERTGKDY